MKTLLPCTSSLCLAYLEGTPAYLCGSTRKAGKSAYKCRDAASRTIGFANRRSLSSAEHRVRAAFATSASCN